MWRILKTIRSSGSLLPDNSKLSINLRDHGGRSDDRDHEAAKPHSIAVRGDGMIFTSACNDHHSTEFWAFDKFGNNVWNYSKTLGMAKVVVGLWQSIQWGKFVPGFLKKMQAI